MNMLRKTTWLVTGRVLGDGLAFVFYVVLARRFGESNVGDYAYAFSLAALVGLGVEFGLRSLLIRNAARDRATVSDYFVTVATLQVTLAVVLALMLHVLSGIAGYSAQLRVLLVLAFASIALRGIATSFVAYLEGIEAMDKSAILDLAGKLTAAACGLLLIFSGASLAVVMYGHVLGSVVYLVMGLYWIRRHFGPVRFHISAKLAKSTLVAAVPFALGAALYELYARVDIIMLHRLVGEAQTGQYAVAMRLVMAPVAVAFLAGVAMYPTLSRSSNLNANPEARDALFLGTLKWLGIFGTTGAVLMFSIGGELLVVLFGQHFIYAGELVGWLAILLFLHVVAVAYVHLLYATNREYTGLRLQALCVGLNVLLNWIFIPKWGAYGAVWASVITQGLLVAAMHELCARHVPAAYGRKAGGLLVASIMAVAASVALRDVVAWPLVGAVALALFGVTAVMAGVLNARDYRKFVAALRQLAVNPLNR